MINDPEFQKTAGLFVFFIVVFICVKINEYRTLKAVKKMRIIEIMRDCKNVQ